MITRVVKMIVAPEELDEFKAIVERSIPIVTAQPGCHEVKFYANLEDPSTCFTVSKWDDVESLELYRKSATFEGLWPQLKAHFAGKPHAWTIE